MDYKTDTPAVVLGMFETGLGVGRSLGSKGVRVYGIDYKKDIGFYSKYIKGEIAPHPLEDEKELLVYLRKLSDKFVSKPVLFITSDDFLEFALKNYDFVRTNFTSNIPLPDVLGRITDKYKLVRAAAEAGINTPRSFLIRNNDDLQELPEFNYPVILKANNVNVWRKKIDGSIKVRMVNSREEMSRFLPEYIALGIEILIQEIIPGKDDKFFKYCTYRSRQGDIISEFMLRKIHQNPVKFGVGSLVVSCYDEELREQGRKLFESLGFSGTGSAEFKFDERDGKYKLIEINPRYWQQNSLADHCGINFPLREYLYLTEQNKFGEKSDYVIGMKWVNIYMDYSSFRDYKKTDGMKLMEWIDDLRGNRVYSDFSSDDVIPGFYELFITGKFRKIPRYLTGKQK